MGDLRLTIAELRELDQEMTVADYIKSIKGDEDEENSKFYDEHVDKWIINTLGKESNIVKFYENKKKKNLYCGDLIHYEHDYFSYTSKCFETKSRAVEYFSTPNNNITVISDDNILIKNGLEIKKLCRNILTYTIIPSSKHGKVIKGLSNKKIFYSESEMIDLSKIDNGDEVKIKDLLKDIYEKCSFDKVIRDKLINKTLFLLEKEDKDKDYSTVRIIDVGDFDKEIGEYLIKREVIIFFDKKYNNIIFTKNDKNSYDMINYADYMNIAKRNMELYNGYIEKITKLISESMENITKE